MGVTKAPFVNFSTSKIFGLAEMHVKFSLTFIPKGQIDNESALITYPCPYFDGGLITLLAAYSNHRWSWGMNERIKNTAHRTQLL